MSESIARLTKQSFAKKFVSLGRVLSHWNDIVGADMAQKAQPLKLHYRKPKDAKEKPQASLDIAASSADATVLHYQKDLILERLNQIFGERWITDIKFIHAPVARDKATAASRKKIVSAAQKTTLEEDLSRIDDEDLRKRLEKLGLGVLSNPKQ